MHIRWPATMTSQPIYRLRAHRGPSPTLAFAVSVVVHVVLVLALYRAYNELASPPLPKLQIAARAFVPRPAAAPGFAAEPLEKPIVSEESARPAPRESNLLRPTPPIADAVLPSRGEPLESSRRTTAEARLPAPEVELPGVSDLPVVENSTIPAVAAAITPLEHLDTLDLARAGEAINAPLRLASRPIDGSMKHRQVDLAVLPANEVDTQRPERHPTAAFSHRGQVGNLPPENTAAIDRGLEYLARVQLDDGRWEFDNLRGTANPSTDPSVERVGIHDDATATGLTLLAFLGAGHDHFDGRFRFVVQDGLQFLVRNQQQHGEFRRDDGRPVEQVMRFYSHGIATLALCEAFGMTGDEQLRRPAQRALDYLAGKQYPGTDGWRVLPGLSCDASVIGWQLAALRSGQLAGLSVRPETIARIGECLAMSRDKEARTEPSPNATSTAVGLAVELHLGGSPSDKRLRPAAEELLAHPPEVGDLPVATETGALDNPQRDTYYWYYGSQAMFYLGGEDWQAWSQKLYPKLMQSQIRVGPLAGSWDPLRRVSESSSGYGGRLYVTAMNLLSLEISNRRVPQGETANPGTSRNLK